MLMDSPAIVQGPRLKFISQEEWVKYDVKQKKGQRYADTGIWVIRNWDSKYFGPITLRVAYEFSRNIPFCRSNFESYRYPKI